MVGWFFKDSSSSGLETVFLASVGDKNQLFFEEAAWVGEVLSSSSFATGSESSKIVEEGASSDSGGDRIPRDLSRETSAPLELAEQERPGPGQPRSG